MKSCSLVFAVITGALERSIRRVRLYSMPVLKFNFKDEFRMCEINFVDSDLFNRLFFHRSGYSSVSFVWGPSFIAIALDLALVFVW